MSTSSAKKKTIESPDLSIPKTSWIYRRLYLFISSIFSAGIIVTVVVLSIIYDRDSEIGSTTIICAFLYIGISMLSYVFGGVMESIKLVEHFFSRNND